MKQYKNLFADKNSEELELFYKQYKEFCKTGMLEDNQLGRMRDEYCELNITGVHMMEMDLLSTISEMWYTRWMGNK